MIATASSAEKRALALELGADAAIDPAPEGLTERLIEANGGQQVDVVFEMAGGEVFEASYRGARAVRADRRVRDRHAANPTRSHGLAAAPLARGGRLLPVPLPRAARDVRAKRSRICSRAPRAASCEAIVGGTYPLAQAAQAQIDLRERRTTGKLLLDPTA